MQRLLNPFVLTVTAILALGYAYTAWRLTSTMASRCLLAVPFALAWAVPGIFWTFERESVGRVGEIVQAAGYLSMGWLNFVLLFLLLRDALLASATYLFSAPELLALLSEQGAELVFIGAAATVGLGIVAALGGPHVRHVRIPIAGLPPEFDGLRIVQISDLHAGPTIGPLYIRRVVRIAKRLAPDLTVLTGDIVDGSIKRLARHVAPLQELASEGKAYLVLGNHDYYSGAGAWTRHFRSLGLKVLLNEYEIIRKGSGQLIIGGVLDPAVRLFDPDQSPRPDLASAPEAGPAFRLLLAHNPKLAPLAEQAGFDLQLSGHTHGGQFFPWTLVVRLIHAPHSVGLSRRGRLWVYVNAGTGSWGPPIRFGTMPELSLLHIVAAPEQGR